MGTLVYGNTDSFEFDDRVLSHLQAVVSTKLRRREAFLLLWTDRTSKLDSVLRSIWMDPAISVQFVFTGPGLPELNQPWVEALISRANSSAGLLLEDPLRAEIREEVPAGTYSSGNTRPSRAAKAR